MANLKWFWPNCSVLQKAKYWTNKLANTSHCLWGQFVSNLSGKSLKIPYYGNCKHNALSLAKQCVENFNSLIDKLLTLNCSIWAQRLMKSGQLSDRKIFQPLILKFLLLRRWWSTESDQQSTKFFILLVNLIAQLISKTLGKLLGWNLPERYFRGTNSKTRPNLFD